jgi:uncharacterized protein (TIGR02599 family)
MKGFAQMLITRKARRGFTLIEIMVATVVMVILMGIIFQLTASMADIWRSTAGKIGAFQGARAGFDAMSRSLEQATLMTYLDYVDDNDPPQPRDPLKADWTPTSYARASELHFITGPSYDPLNPSLSLVPGANANNTQGHAVFFQAPLGVVKDKSSLSGLNELLNAVGFFVEYTDDMPIWPAFIRDIMGSTPRYRFRLMQWIQPTEQFQVYNETKPAGSSYNYSRKWFFNQLPTPGATSVPASQTRARMIAENVIAVFFRPRLSEADEDQIDGPPVNSATGGRLAPTYRYDSRMWTKGYVDMAFRANATFAPGGPKLVNLWRNQLPPLLDVVLVAIDPKDADRLCRQESIPDVLRIPPNTFHLRSQPNAADFLENDIEQYEAQLGAAGVNFRTFRATLTLKGAKWSAD